MTKILCEEILKWWKEEQYRAYPSCSEDEDEHNFYNAPPLFVEMAKREIEGKPIIWQHPKYGNLVVIEEFLMADGNMFYRCRKVLQAVEYISFTVKNENPI